LTAASVTSPGGRGFFEGLIKGGVLPRNFP